MFRHFSQCMLRLLPIPLSEKCHVSYHDWSMSLTVSQFHFRKRWPLKWFQMMYKTIKNMRTFFSKVEKNVRNGLEHIFSKFRVDRIEVWDVHGHSKFREEFWPNGSCWTLAWRRILRSFDHAKQSTVWVPVQHQLRLSTWRQLLSGQVPTYC